MSAAWLIIRKILLQMASRVYSHCGNEWARDMDGFYCTDEGFRNADGNQFKYSAERFVFSHFIISARSAVPRYPILSSHSGLLLNVFRGASFLFNDKIILRDEKRSNNHYVIYIIEFFINFDFPHSEQGASPSSFCCANSTTQKSHSFL